ncbi:acetyl ornithine aminotransferase family protein [Candidatus Sumerlaeota bacterium]|nr:acetyl ornithine aminotransferase family protein [Candidatus Sumerlaeota bacterium]
MLPKIISKKLPGPKARKIIERDKRILSPSYTRDYPLVIEKGEGCLVTDPDGNVFLDCAAGIAVCSTGHSHPQVVKAIKDQADRFIHMSGTDFYYEPQVILAEMLAKHRPFKDDARVFFTNSGAEAVEAAFKLSRYHTGRDRAIAFYGAFHGRTMGALSLTASKVIQKKGFTPLVPGVHHVNYCYPHRCPFHHGNEPCCEHYLDELEDTIFEKTLDPERVAAIFVEPIQGEGGYVVPARGFLDRLRAICDKYGMLLVFDEVQSGIGRTGKFFAAEHFGVEPDIVCMAKGIASGMPLGGIMAKAQVMDWPYGAHASTFGGNPVACAAGIATVDLVEKKLMNNAAEIGRLIMKHTKDWAKRHDIVGEVRGKGLMIGFEIVQRGGKDRPAPTLRNEIIERAFQHGLLILGCGPNTVRFCPPLVINEKQAMWAMDTLEKVIIAVEKPSSKDLNNDNHFQPLSAGRRLQGAVPTPSKRPGARPERRSTPDRRTKARKTTGRRVTDSKVVAKRKTAKKKAKKRRG